MRTRLIVRLVASLILIGVGVWRIANAAGGSSPSSSVASNPVPHGPATGAGNGSIVPGGLVGRRLDLALGELQSQNVSSIEEPVTGTEPLRDWGVCSSTPSAGQAIEAVVVLHIRHFGCGGGSDSATATGSTSGERNVEAAWHQVTEALARQDGATACADMTAPVRSQFAANGSSCEQVVRKQIGFFLHGGDVGSVAGVTVTGVVIQGDRATVYYDTTNGLVDLDSAVSLLGPELGFTESSHMQRVGGKWLLAPNAS